ncbi:MAG: HPr family phosphocarrier protein [Ruminococcus sp.]|nr:HPr family phosphocarrier protein [Ruminococcus sp.]MBR6670059.1 HPr family phosphocarrier protein [Ruminococcus sp.]
MQTLKYTITDSLGIHARPAGLLVKKASEFSSAVSVSKNDKTANAKKIFSVMSLAVKCGDEITVTADGSDEAEAIKAIESFLHENL